MALPLEIIGLGKATVDIRWDENRVDHWTARALRLMCRCAHCQSEFTGEPLLDPATVPADIAVKDMTLVGNYGLNIHFTDGHNTGIYRLKDLFDRGETR